MMENLKPFQLFCKKINDAIDRVEVGDDGNLRKRHFYVLALVGVPTMILFGLHNRYLGNHLLSVVIFLSSASLVVGGIALLRTKNVIVIYRLCGAVYCGLLLYMLIIGGDGGSKILWMYTLPLIVFFLMGKREGLLWVGVTFLAVLAMMLIPLPLVEIYQYPNEFTIRFLTSYFIICTATYWFEYFRFSYQQQLQDEQKRFREILKHSRDILYRRDLKTGEYQYISKAFCGHLGYSRAEVNAMKYQGVEELIHPEDRGKHDLVVQQTLDNSLAKLADFTVEYRMRHKNGMYFWFSDQITLIHDSSGLPQFVIGSNREITVERQNRVDLKNVRDQLVTILNSIDAHIYVAEMHSHEILFMNNKMKQDFGEDFKGKMCWKAFRNETGPCAHCSNGHLLDENNNPAGLYEWQGFNPITRRWYNNYDRAVQWIDGTLVRLQIAVDITRIKEMEEERQRNKETLDRAKELESIGTLAGGIAHDFNNLLQIISGNISLVEGDELLSSDNLSYLEQVKDATDKAQELTNRLITFSTGGLPKRVAMPITSLLREITTELVEGSVITCEMLLPPELWSIPIDPDQMTVVIKNLVVNACESMPDGGGLTVSAENYTKTIKKGQNNGAVPQGRYVMISIRDTGCGIIETVLPEIFKPYFSTKKKGTQKGQGMGLSIVYSIIKRHHGQIVVNSVPDTGTTVNIYLPVDNEEAGGKNAHVKEKESRQYTETKKILLMDDEKMIRTLAVGMFGRLGYQVDLAKDGQEAIEHYIDQLNEGKRYLLVVLDLMVVKGMGGRQAIEKLLEIDGDVRAVVSSGYSGDPVITNYKSYGFCGSLTKPYTSRQIEELFDRLQIGTKDKSIGDCRNN